MNCRNVERLLTEDYRSAHNPEVACHLDQCEGCRALYRDLKALAELSGKLKKETEAPAFFVSRVCARLPQRGPARRSLKLAVVAVSTVVILSLGFLKFSFLAEKPEGTANQSMVVTRSAGEDWSVEEDWRTEWPVAESGVLSAPEAKSDFVEILVSKPSESDYIVRLPSTIEVRNSQAENEYYLRNVSH